jgi:hypothetical protein
MKSLSLPVPKATICYFQSAACVSWQSIQTHMLMSHSGPKSDTLQVSKFASQAQSNP